MIAFTSLLWIWKGKAAGRWHFLTVPEELSGAIRAHAFEIPRGFRSVRVEARIGQVAWHTSVFPLDSGGYVLPVKADVRKRARLSVGDEVKAVLTLL
ncbi:MAG: DUF1905 domain-containing protein [Sphingomicrobium sp.]